MQMTVQRKFTRSMTYSLAYTWSKAMETANGDGDTTSAPDIRKYDYRRASFDRTHILAINYVWNLPKLSTKLGDNWLVRRVFDDWELSGISQFATGSPLELGFPSLQPARSQSITGSPDIGPRLLLTGDPTGSGTRTQWFDPSVLRLPDIGSDGFGPRQYLTNPGLNVHDLSIFKNFPLGGDSSRSLQIRFEMFNAFNHPNFSGVSTGLTWNVAADFSDYKAKQQFSPEYVRNTRGGVNPPTSSRLGQALGEVNGVQGAAPYRVIQLAAKIYF